MQMRRAVNALPALTALGPGGCFGESVLGYATDLARQAAEQASRLTGTSCGLNEWLRSDSLLR
jgi:hypothetical protein